MSKSVKKPLKHKLSDPVASGSSAKRLRVSCNVPAANEPHNDSGIGTSVSRKKKTATRRKVKSDKAVPAKRCLNPTVEHTKMEVSEMDVTQLLAVGEGNVMSMETQGMSESSDSEGYDWEEVGEAIKEPVIPKEGVNITLEAPIISFKRKKKANDMQDEIRRQLKRRQKEIQELMHKVHLLCWIAHIKFVNAVLNDETLLAMSISMIGCKNLYPPKRADCDYLERVVNWFTKTIVIATEVKYSSDSSISALQELTIQFETKTAFTKKYLIFMFVAFLRSLGLQARLITSVVVVPLRPSGEKDVSSLNKRKKVEPKVEIDGEEIESEKPNTNTKPVPKKGPKGVAAKKELTPKVAGKLEKQIAEKSIKQESTKGKKEKPSVSLKDSPPCTSSEIAVKRETRQTKNGKTVVTTKKVASSSLESKGKSPLKKTAGNDNDDDDEEEFSKYFKETPKPAAKKVPIKAQKNELEVKPSTSKNVSPVCQKIKDEDSEDDFSPSRKPNAGPKKKLDRRVLSSDDDNLSPTKRQGLDYWVEVFLEAEEKWITVDIVKKKIHCTRQLCARATQPVAYVLACNNNSTLKDVTKRYVTNWHSDTRKRRVAEAWWKETLWPFLPPVTAQDREEDEDIARQLQDMPLPTSIAEYKFHPLYALKRHLLKFEGIYPPEAPPIGFIRKEPVYARECVVTLRSREIWYKEARVVRRNETPYKIVKSRPKYDKMTGDWRRDLPLELFGFWQTEDFIPPIAVDGKVPRNEYGNVDLFKACMLPTGTVHIQVPALNRVAKKLGIDCAPAIVGFEFHSGGSHPVQDGFVVCEEFKDKVLDAWNKEIDESAKRAEEKREKRIYGNWRRLIRGLFIRERLKIKYAFDQTPEDGASTSTQYLKAQKGEDSG